MYVLFLKEKEKSKYFIVQLLSVLLCCTHGELIIGAWPLLNTVYYRYTRIANNFRFSQNIYSNFPKLSQSWENLLLFIISNFMKEKLAGTHAVLYFCKPVSRRVTNLSPCLANGQIDSQRPLYSWERSKQTACPTDKELSLVSSHTLLWLACQKWNRLVDKWIAVKFRYVMSPRQSLR